MKDKLRNLGVPQSVVREFVDDIFGKQTGSHFEAGLVDSESEAVFRNVLSKLQYRWNNLERSCIPNDSEPQFHACFCKFKAEDIIKCVLPGVRSQAGADPGRLFTTNCSESINQARGRMERKQTSTVDIPLEGDYCTAQGRIREGYYLERRMAFLSTIHNIHNITGTRICMVF